MQTQDGTWDEDNTKTWIAEAVRGLGGFWMKGNNYGTLVDFTLPLHWVEKALSLHYGTKLHI